jgi:hypothetical protein
MLLFACLIISAVSAAEDFKIDEGFDEISESYFTNEETGMNLYLWDYDDETIQEYYLQNDTDYSIVSGDNNTYNVSYNSHGTISSLMDYANDGNVSIDHGILEIAEVDGHKYVFMTYIEEGSKDDWKVCFDELMKFNENNGIVPLADAI